MLQLKSFGKAFGWLLIGIVFGIASLLSIFASKLVFTHDHISFNNLFDSNFVMFLCIALMGGAGADFLFNNYFHLGTRGFYFLLILFALGIVCYLFNPNNSKPPEQDVVHILAIGYGIFTFVYCIGIKSVLFYHEGLKKLKNNL